MVWIDQLCCTEGIFIVSDENDKMNGGNIPDLCCKRERKLLNLQYMGLIFSLAISVPSSPP